MLIQKGFNPKMGLYRSDDFVRTITIPAWANQLGKNFTKLNNNFWFCIKPSECDKKCLKGCKDKVNKFIYTKGHRTLKNVKLGQGGFGKVYLGNIHGVKVGAKYIDVTNQYKELLGAPGSTFSPTEVIPNLLGDLAFEATLLADFGHPNILKVRDWWIQCSGLNVVNPQNNNPIIDLVIATPKCYKNLQEWLDTEPFHFAQVQRFLVQIAEALQYLEAQNPPLSHRDVKPANILISAKSNPNALLGDFGLVKTETGLTPVYCPPERFKKNGNVTGLSDVYSLGVTTLVSFFDNDDAMGILFGAFEQETEQLSNVLSNPVYGPVLDLVQKMIKYDPTERPNFSQVQIELSSLPARVSETGSTLLVKNGLVNCLYGH